MRQFSLTMFSINYLVCKCQQIVTNVHVPTGQGAKTTYLSVYNWAARKTVHYLYLDDLIALLFVMIKMQVHFINAVGSN